MRRGRGEGAKKVGGGGGHRGTTTVQPETKGRGPQGTGGTRRKEEQGEKEGGREPPEAAERWAGSLGCTKATMAPQEGLLCFHTLFLLMSTLCFIIAPGLNIP